jgi:hypothetical protein
MSPEMGREGLEYSVHSDENQNRLVLSARRMFITIEQRHEPKQQTQGQPHHLADSRELSRSTRTQAKRYGHWKQGGKAKPKSADTSSAFNITVTAL